MVHRDTKPSNILVSNLHYEKDNMQEMVKTRTIVCKLGDLGEARSRFLQTIRDTKTTKRKVNRGSVAFRALETLVDNILLLSATVYDDDDIFYAESIFQTPFRK